MLQELIIDNLALLKHIHISFNKGMTCLTGETGAGKSIMLDAINLAMGGKAESNLLTGPTANVTASFQLDGTNYHNNEAYQWLKNNNFIDETRQNTNIHTCIINRKFQITKDTDKKIIKSKVFINNIPASLQQLKQLGQLLLYIHGQHEHLNLLKETNQLKILDHYGQHNALSQDVYNLYNSWAKSKQLLETALEEQTKFFARKQLLEFQIAELASAELTVGEWIEINSQYQWLANQQEYIEKLNQISFILNGSTSETECDPTSPNLVQQANQVINLLANINFENKIITDLSDYINQASININEASFELHKFLSKVENDPLTLESLDKRISKLQDLARKYKTTPDNLANYYEQCQAEFKQLESQEDMISNLKNNLVKLEQEYKIKAQNLTLKRQDTGIKLSARLTELLKTLRLEDALVSITFKANNNTAPAAHGNEMCEFLIKTNRDQNLSSLSSSVSGGELSRLALATQVAIAEIEGTPSLIFDEVDVGIGGGTAEIVGKLLRKMGNNTQVMCITHLAQVASQADQHIRVSKSIVNNTTQTNIEYLNKQERIAELARMIGGLTITPQTLLHAQELLETAGH